MGFTFELVWNCRARPFWHGIEYVEFTAVSEMDAELMVLAVTPDGPFLHRDCRVCGGNTHHCCYIASHKRVYEDGAFTFKLQLPEDWFQ